MLFGREFDTREMSVEPQPGSERFTKIGEDESVTVPRKEDTKTSASEIGFPTKVKDISGKIDKDAFGKEFDVGKMSVDQQPGLESLTVIAEDKPVGVSEKEKDLKKSVPEGSSRKDELIAGKMDRDSFGKELDMDEISIDLQSCDESSTTIVVPEQDKDIKKPASDRYPRQIDEIPSKIDKDAFGREFVTGEMSVDQQPDSKIFTKIEDKPVTVPGKEDTKKPASEEGSPREVKEISGKIDNDAFGKELDMGDILVDQQFDDENLTKTAEAKPASILGKDKDAKKLASEGSPRQFVEIPGKMDKDAFGRKIDVGKMSVDQQPDLESLTEIAEDRPVAVPVKEKGLKKLASEGSSKKDELIAGKMDRDSFGKELDMDEISIDQQSCDESSTTIVVPEQDKDIKKPASDRYPRQIDEIPSKIDKDAFGREFVTGEMSVDQQPDSKIFTKIEDKPVTVPGKEDTKKPASEEGSPRKGKEISGKIDNDAFGKELDMGDILVDQQFDDENLTKTAEAKPASILGKDKDAKKLASEGSPRQFVEIPGKMDKDAFGRKIDVGKMSVDQQPDLESLTEIAEDRPVAVPVKEKGLKKLASEGSSRKDELIAGKMDRDSFGKELDMDEISIDQQSCDESSTTIVVPEQDKDIKKPASDRYPRQIDEIPSKIDKDAFGREFVTGEMSVDQQPDSKIFTKIEDKPVTVPGKEDTKKPASEEGSPREVKEISGKIDNDAFGKELDMGDILVDQQFDDENLTKAAEAKPASILGKDKDAKKLASEGSPRQFVEIPGKMDKDAFGRKIDVGKMSVDQQPDLESLTEIAEDKPVAVPVKEKGLKKPASEGSSRKDELIAGKMDRDSFGKELDMDEISIDQQSCDESSTTIVVPEQDKDIKKPASDRYPRQIDEIPSKIDKDAFGREFVTGEMSVDQQPDSKIFTKIEDKPVTVPGKEDTKKPASEEGSPREVKEISGKIDNDAFGKELDMGDILVDQQFDDENLTKTAEAKPASILGKDKDAKKLASEGSPRQFVEIPGKMDKDAFGRKIDVGKMSVDQQPDLESLTEIAEDKPVAVPVKEKGLKKLASEGSSRKDELIAGKMDRDSFGKELDMDEISIDQQSCDESSTTIVVPEQDKDIKKPASDQYPRQIDEIPSKIDKDAFGREFVTGEMSVDQQPDSKIFTKIEDKPVTVPGKEDTKKPASEEGSPREVKEISGKIDNDAFGKELDMGDILVDQQFDDENLTKAAEAKPASILGKDKDAKKLASEGSPRQFVEIPGKMDKDAFGRKIDVGKMSVDQQPDLESLTEIAEDKPVAVPVKEKGLKKPASEGSSRKDELIAGKMDRDSFGKELDMDEISIDQQSYDESP